MYKRIKGIAMNRLVPKAMRTSIYTRQYFAKKLSYTIYNGDSISILIDEALDMYLAEEEKSNLKYLKEVVYKIIKGNLKYGFKPHEFFLYGLIGKPEEEWAFYMSEQDRVTTLQRLFGSTIKAELRDKWRFYELARPFFKRKMFRLTPSTDVEQYSQFVIDAEHVFCKPTQGHMGIGVHKEDIYNIQDAQKLREKLLAEDTDWVIEECIKQEQGMSAWNESSVNTIRFPAFLKNGEFIPFYPRIRVGRKGQIIDNVSQGGLVALIDAKTGVICSDGFIKAKETVEVHPDSGLRFKGTKIPQWEELLEYAEQLHRSLPQHVYIAWDFALTENGWDVIEANWGQMDATQMMIGHGIKEVFHRYIEK